MITYWPDYCKSFRCKGSGCIHTCCAGWVIGIDEDSLERFKKDPEVADKISDGCFALREDGDFTMNSKTILKLVLAWSARKRADWFLAQRMVLNWLLMTARKWIFPIT